MTARERRGAPVAQRATLASEAARAGGIFDAGSTLFARYHARLVFRDRLVGGVPKDPKLIEGWLRRQAGLEEAGELRRAMLRTLAELGAEVEADMTFEQLEQASAALAASKQTTGFKRGERGLYVEAPQLKAMLKESTNVLFGGERRGATRKGPKTFVAERVFVEPDRLWLGVQEPSGVELLIGHLSRPARSEPAQPGPPHGPRPCRMRGRAVVGPAKRWMAAYRRDGRESRRESMMLMLQRLRRAGATLRSGAGVVSAAGLLALAGSAPAWGQSRTGPALTAVADRPLPGDTSRFDYLSLDPGAHRLYIAHLGAGTVVAYDTEAGTVLGEIAEVPGVHGVLAVPDLGRVYATATGADQVAVIDPGSLAVVATVPGGRYPDGLAYDPELGKLYVSDETGGTDTVIDTSTNQVVATIDLGGDVGNTQFDPASHRILVAVGARNQLAAIDPSIDRVVATIDTPGCDQPHGLVLDPDQRRAFVACQGNDKLVVLDLGTTQPLFTDDVGKDPDVVAFDPALHLVYVGAERGPLTIFGDDGGAVRRIGQQDVGPDAHAVAVDPETHHLYVPLQNLNGRPVLRELAPEGQ
jgi:YVTN family beta-propeller protein